MRFAWVWCLCAVVIAACTAGSGDQSSTAEHAGDGAWSGPVVVGEAPHWSAPFLDVAIGLDDVPTVVFHDSTSGVVEYRRCVDSGCVEPPEVATIDVPSDLFLSRVSLEVSPSNLPVITMQGAQMDGEGNMIRPLIYLISCDDPQCATRSLSRIENEWNPDVAFAPNGSLVMASINDTALLSGDVEAPADIRLLIRVCGDRLCEAELSRADIAMYESHQYASLILDPDGIPTVALGQGTAALREGGGGIAVLVSCEDAACSSYDIFESEIEGQYVDHVDATFSEGPFVAYGSEQGVNALIWSEGLSEAATIVPLDQIGGDDQVLVGGVASGPNLRPTVLYLRALNYESENEFQQILIAECDDITCSSGTLCAVFSETEDTYLASLPALVTDVDGSPAITFHTCHAGCKPQYVNVVRYANGCAQAFPDQVIGAWGKAS
jgi:hypothetical protein